MSQYIPEADLVAVPPAADVSSARLTRGAISWSIFEGARDPYVILIIIYIFMPYVGSVMVGWPKSNPTAGQEVISQWSQYSGWLDHGDGAVPRRLHRPARPPQGLAGPGGRR